MKITDLGTLTGQVLLFGGPYSNLQATQALLDQAKQRGIPPENVICTGDVVAYGAHPAETVEAIQSFGGPVVAGNMEIQLGAGAQDCGCGFEEGTACDVMSGAWFAHAARHVTQAQRAWMAACPGRIVFTYENRRYAVLHGGASDVSLFLWPTTSQEILAAEWQLAEQQVGPIDVVISGHSGMSFMHDFSFGTWINAGVIGMPAHDGNAATQFVTLEGHAATEHRLHYDQDAACAAMEAAGLVQGYHRALVTGYWPSEDVLPPELTLESRASG